MMKLCYLCYHIILNIFIEEKKNLNINFSSYIHFVWSLNLPCTLILLISIVEPILFGVENFCIVIFVKQTGLGQVFHL